MHTMIFKLLTASIIASVAALFVGAISLLILKCVVYIFQLNYHKDAYWVLTSSFHAAVISWILSFIFSLVLMENK
jgi:hypothetical protein